MVAVLGGAFVSVGMIGYLASPHVFGILSGKLARPREVQGAAVAVVVFCLVSFVVTGVTLLRSTTPVVHAAVDATLLMTLMSLLLVFVFEVGLRGPVTTDHLGLLDGAVLASGAMVTGAATAITTTAITTAGESPAPLTLSRVLVVEAHPDDLELACGGTVAALVAGGHAVRVLVMSCGQQGGDPEVRKHEARRGAAVLGVTDVTVLDLPDTRLADANIEMIAAVEHALADFSPSVVLTHSEHDQHQDHQAVHRAVVRAGRKVPTILGFESPSVTRHFNPSVFIDVDAFLDLKVLAVDTHRDQSGKPYMTSARVRGMAAFRGSQAKCAHAEAFEPVRYSKRLQESPL